MNYLFLCKINVVFFAHNFGTSYTLQTTYLYYVLSDIFDILFLNRGISIP